jgi:hypothetical protein
VVARFQTNFPRFATPVTWNFYSFRAGTLFEIAQSVLIGRPGFDPRQRQRIFLLASASRPAMGPTQPPAQWVSGGGGGRYFPGGKARPGRDADHSTPSGAEVENEQELYLLSPQAPQWRVAGHLYFYPIRNINCPI